MSKKIHVVDLRSDTQTRPTKEMRKAMANAEVGDDVYGEDPTVNKLQALAAEIFGKDDALFVPTGTMANLISMLCHCWERGSEVILGDQSHIYCWEQGGMAQLGSIVPRPTPNLPDGTLDLSEVRRIYNDGSDAHFSKTSVIAIENTINGKVLPMSFMTNLRELANQLNLPIHLDGARVFNAATALNISVKEIAGHVDTLSVCLSKGLGAPVGSLIIGPREFIKRAHRVRKCVGGGMRQAGVLAAAGILAITDMVKRLHLDHENALRFAIAVQDIGPDVFDLSLSSVQSNMTMFEVNEKLFGQNGAEELCKLMGKSTKDSPISVKILFLSPTIVRAVFHLDVTQADVAAAVDKLRLVVEQARNASSSLKQ